MRYLHSPSASASSFLGEAVGGSLTSLQNGRPRSADMPCVDVDPVVDQIFFSTILAREAPGGLVRCVRSLDTEERREKNIPRGG